MLILLASSLIYGKALKFNESDIEKIKLRSDKKQILTRIKNYKKLRSKIQDFTYIRKLSHVNSFFNNILPKFDQQRYGISDYWSTRKEFLIDGRGDCEDYTIAKYFSLIENGFDKNNLYLAVCVFDNRETKHMVLLYFKDKESIPYVLDNLSFKVLPLDKRPRINMEFIFNESASYLMENNKISKKVNINWGEFNKWEDLLTRVYVNNE